MSSNDPLSDFLDLVEARSVLSGGFTAGGSWALRFPPPDELKFSVIVKGGCWIVLDGESALRGEQGDVALLPGRRGYVVASSLEATPIDAMSFFGQKDDKRELPHLGEGDDFMVVAGGVTLAPWSAALVTEALPPIVRVSGRSPRADSLRWIVDRIAEERGSTTPGARTASAQLAELFFIEVLRSHLASAEAPPAGWLRAVSDARMAPALRLIHNEPGRPWKLTELAKASGMSRTSFAVHFRSVAGMSPLAYLTSWRMRLAEKMLRRNDATLVTIAGSLGYASESAFSHAFKRVTGSRPRAFRDATSNDRAGSSNARAFRAGP